MKRVRILYFFSPSCRVCLALRPKLEAVAEKLGVDFCTFNVDECKKEAAQRSVFSVPALIVEYENKEVYRKARYFSVQEVEDFIKRITSL